MNEVMTNLIEQRPIYWSIVESCWIHTPTAKRDNRTMVGQLYPHLRKGNATFWARYHHQQSRIFNLTAPYMIQRAGTARVRYMGATLTVPNARGVWPPEYGGACLIAQRLA